MGSVLKTEIHCTYIGNAWIQRILLRGDKKLEDNTVLMPVPRKQLYIYIYISFETKLKLLRFRLVLITAKHDTT